MSTLFRPQTTAELKARRQALVDSLAPRTVEDLVELRDIEFITLDDEQILDEILGLDFVIGD